MTLRKLLLTLFLLATSVRTGAFETGNVMDQDGSSFTVVRVDPARDELRLFHRDGSGTPLNDFPHLLAWAYDLRKHIVFAMNAGMFEPDFSPVGLMVQDGRTVSPLNLAAGDGNFYLKPNGVFLVSNGKAWIMESSEFERFSAPVQLATQSGPLLVRQGHLHSAFHEESTSRLRRNGVGVTSTGIALFVISDGPVNLHAFASVFRDRLECPDALFLDGNVSSLYAPTLGRSDAGHALGPIIGIVE